MADYNIYIHAIGTGTQTAFNPTTPWSQRGEGGKSPTQPWDSGGTGIIGSLQSGMAAGTMLGGSEAIAESSEAATSGGWGSVLVTAAVFVAKQLIQLPGKIETYQALMSGDKMWLTFREDVRQGFQNTMKPLSTEKQAHYNRIQIAQQNQKRALDRELLGDSVINRYAGRGV